MSFSDRVLGFGAFPNRDTTYEIEQSLMFEPNAHLSRDVGSASNRKTWTWSAWIKRGSLGTSNDQMLFNAYANTGGSDSTYFAIRLARTAFGAQTDSLVVNGWNTNWRITSRLLRDPSAWYHIVVAVDTTQSTANDRIKVYINGSQVTSFQTTNNPSEDDDLGVNLDNYHMIGAENLSGSDRYYSGYMAEVHFIDGTALAASAFGETHEDTGQWIPKEYDTASGAYGTNGFYLKFVSGAIGTDSSGEGNNYTTANIANADVMLDTPTNNFATLNPIDNGDISDDLSQGNLKKQAHDQAPATFWLSSGKWYCEVALLSGSSSSNTYNYAIYVNDSKAGATWGAWDKNYVALSLANGGTQTDVFSIGTDTNGTATQPTGSRPAAVAIIGVAIDVDDGDVEYYVNGSLNGKVLGITDWTLPLTVNLAYSTSSITANANNQVINFGQNGTFCGNVTAGGNADGNGYGDFKYSPPTGYLAMCTANLPAPTITKGTDYFNTILYTGNDTDDRTLTGVGFQPDWVWFKTRNEAANWHTVFDSVRGVSKRIFPNDQYQELTESDPNNSLVAFTSDGFTVDDSSGHSDLNASAHTYVAWNWKAGGSGSTNDDGAEDTTVSVNTDAGFSIVTFTGTGSTTTYGHGLGVVPQIYITKSRGATGDWYFTTTLIDGSVDYLVLNSNAAKADGSVTAPTSSVFYTGYGSSATALAYCFAEKAGYSSFGTYIGNNSADGPFIFTGFRPAFTIIKRTDSTASWFMYDNKRDTFNAVDEGLFADGSWVESTQTNGMVDYLSNGFKIRNTGTAMNASSGTYIYMAFAESPFKYSNAR